MSFSDNFPNTSPSLLLDFANAKELDPRITFTRTTTAVYYDGVTTAKAEENLLANSQVYTDASYWTNNIGMTITSSTETAPDGTSTATKFTANNGVTAAYIGKNNTGITLTNALGTIDLSTGSTNTTFGTFDTFTATEFPSGSGWYRIVVEQDGYFFSFHAKAAEYTYAGVQVTANTVRMYACNQSGSTSLSPAGDGTDGILIWGAQLEQRSAVSSYTPTTTQPITNYIPVLQTAASGVARFDHNPTTGESLGLLVEEQRTNLLTYSDDFANAAWTKTRASITSNTIVAPDGTLTGDKFVEDTSASNTHIVSRVVITTAAAHTMSFYAKAAERTFVRGLLFDGTNFYTAYFDLTNGTVGTLSGTGTSASITSVGNGWYRCVVTATTAASSSSQVVIRTATANGTDSYTGDGYSGIYIWGAQLEAGAFPTSYIATTSASVTRNADAASMTGTNFSSWYRADEGTVYAEASALATGYNGSIVAFSDGTLNNRIVIRGMNTSSQSASIGIVSGTTQWAVVKVSQTTASTKLVVGYKVDDISFVRNADSPSTDTSALLPVVNQARIGVDGDGTLFYNGTIRKIAFYPSRLTNAQLQALTS